MQSVYHYLSVFFLLIFTIKVIRVDSYKPVVLIHGMLDHPFSLVSLATRIEEVSV